MRLSGILMAVDHHVALRQQNQFKIRRHFAALSAADSWIRFESGSWSWSWSWSTELKTPGPGQRSSRSQLPFCN